jgi:hypothetical protein
LEFNVIIHQLPGDWSVVVRILGVVVVRGRPGTEPVALVAWNLAISFLSESPYFRVELHE